MNSTTYIITFRADASGQREANLATVLQWLAQWPNLDVVLVEQDDVSRISTKLPAIKLRHVFAYNPGPFNKSWGFNIGARLSQQPYLVFGDADVIVTQGLSESIAALQRGRSLAKPYRRLIDLSAEQTKVLRASGEIKVDAGQGDRSKLGEHIVLCGGVFAIERGAFVHIGCWDERFVGWGAEDDAMSYKVERARLSAEQFDLQPAVHLHHPRSPATTMQQPHYDANVAVLQQLRDLSDTELKRLAEVNRQITGQPEKYRPLEIIE
jgi:N-terminal domain of galactosyltransferase